MVQPSLVSSVGSQGSVSFRQALHQSQSPSLFTDREQHVLIGLCLSVFLIPIIGSVVLTRIQSSSVLERGNTTTQAMMLQPATVSQSSDEVAMAGYFIEKATQLGSSPDQQAQAATFLSQAQALLTTTTQTGATVDQLRTQVATLMGQPTADPSIQRVAAAASSSASSVSGAVTSNASGNTITMKAGYSTLFVAAPTLKEGSQVYITIANNRDNAVIYVKQKDAGKGFTLASTAPLSQDSTITWYEIETQ